MYARAGAGPPEIVTLSKNVDSVVGISWCCGTPTRPTAPPGRAMPSAVTIDWVVADALEHGVDAVAPGQLAYALDRLVPALADDVGGAEVATKCDPVGVVAEQDDLVGAETLGGDDAAQPDRAVADDGDALPRRHARRARGVVSGAHHVRQRQQRRDQSVVLTRRERDERSVCEWHAYRLTLTAVDAVSRPPAAVQAGRVQPFVAEDAGAVRPRERGDDEIAGLDRAHVGAHVLDDTDELVAHPLPGLARLQLVVRPEIAAADAGARDADERIGGLDQARVGDVLDPDIAGAVHDSCAHVSRLPFDFGEKNGDRETLKHATAAVDRPC